MPHDDFIKVVSPAQLVDENGKVWDIYVNNVNDFTATVLLRKGTVSPSAEVADKNPRTEAKPQEEEAKPPVYNSSFYSDKS